MKTSIYQINKGVNNSIEFKGLKAQYIGYLGIGLVVLLVLFAVLYVLNVNTYVCLGAVVVATVLLFMAVYRLSNKYGQYGMMKAIARWQMPRSLRCYSRKMFWWHG